MFVNPLKDDTTRVIKILNENDLDNRVISGDNLLTVVDMGKNSNILSHEKSI